MNWHIIREDFQLEKDAVFEKITDTFLKQSDLDVRGFSKQIYHSTITDICDRTFCYGYISDTIGEYSCYNVPVYTNMSLPDLKKTLWQSYFVQTLIYSIHPHRVLRNGYVICCITNVKHFIGHYKKADALDVLNLLVIDVVEAVNELHWPTST